MTTNIRELLPLYALGSLEDDEARAVEDAVQGDPTMAAELDRCLDLVPTVQPSAGVKARLMASVGGGRLEKFSGQMSKLLDLTVDRAREILGLVERKASWENPVPGIHLVHFSGGPAYAAADCGFVRIEPGCTFPWHKHRGEEVSVILEGTLTDNLNGKVYGVGDELVHATGTEHDLTAGPDGVLYVARAMDGIEVSGQRQ